jgi:hypothetical protein
MPYSVSLMPANASPSAAVTARSIAAIRLLRAFAKRTASAIVKLLGQQDCGVDRAQHDARVPARRGEGLGERGAGDGVAEEERAEEQRLGSEEHPHAEVRRVTLLL